MPKNIIYIENDLQLRESIVFNFKLEKHLVEDFESPKKALEFIDNLTNFTIDIFIIDFQLNDLNTLDFIKELKNRNLNKPILVLVDNMMFKKSLEKLSVEKIISKPINDIDILNELINKL